MQSRRQIIVYVRPDDILMLFSRCVGSGYICLASLKEAADIFGNKVDIPDEADIEDVAYFWERKQFGLRLSHSTFAEVAEGEMAPAVYLKLTAITAHRTHRERPDDPDSPLVIEAPT